MNWIEIVGFVTGALSVWLAARGHVWTWPIGIVNSACWLLLFWTTRLYFDSTLQLVYIALGSAGWYWWLYGGPARDDLPVSGVSRRLAAFLVVIGLTATALLWWVDANIIHSAMPMWDASTTVLSLVATYLLCRKLIATWWIWIAVDFAYIWMYTTEGLYLTAALQPLFIAMCIVGLIGWRRKLSDEDPPKLPVLGESSA